MQKNSSDVTIKSEKSGYMKLLEEQDKRIKKGIWLSFLSSFLFIIFAFILLFKKGDIISTLFLVIGYLGLIMGSLYFIRYFKSDKSVKSYSVDAFYGVTFVLFGIIFILRSDVLANMLTYLLGAYLIYKNASRLQTCLNFSAISSRAFWNYLLVFSVIGMILGFIIIFNPFEGRITITSVIAYCVILSEIIHVLQGIAILIGSTKKYEDKSSKE